MLDTFLNPLPLVPILRGITPTDVVAICEVLIEEGYRILEVPLNSPEPFASIEALAKVVGGRALVGAGTVLDPAAVGRVANAGGEPGVLDLTPLRELVSELAGELQRVGPRERVGRALRQAADIIDPPAPAR